MGIEALTIGMKQVRLQQNASLIGVKMAIGCEQFLPSQTNGKLFV